MEGIAVIADRGRGRERDLIRLSTGRAHWFKCGMTWPVVVVVCSNLKATLSCYRQLIRDKPCDCHQIV